MTETAGEKGQKQSYLSVVGVTGQKVVELLSSIKSFIEEFEGR